MVVVVVLVASFFSSKPFLRSIHGRTMTKSARPVHFPEHDSLVPFAQQPSLLLTSLFEVGFWDPLGLSADGDMDFWLGSST